MGGAADDFYRAMGAAAAVGVVAAVVMITATAARAIELLGGVIF